MNLFDDLVLILLVLIGIRFFAFLVSMELYSQHRDNRHALLIAAWFIYFLSPIFGLQAYLKTGDPAHPLFSYLAAVGTLLIMLGLFHYFRSFPNKWVIGTLFIVLAVLGIINMSFLPEIASYASVITQAGLLLWTIIVFFTKRKEFIAIGRNSYYWLLPIIIIGLIHAIAFVFIYPGARASFKFFVTFLLNVGLVFYFMLFEYNQLITMSNTSGERYRSLFEDAPIALWEEDITFLNTYLKDLGSVEVEDINGYFQKHPELMRKFLENRTIRDMNQEALVLFEARNRYVLREFLENVDRPELHHIFQELIEAYIIGKSELRIEAILYSMQGNPIHVIMNVNLPDLKRDSNVVIISCVDISELKRAEEIMKVNSTIIESTTDAVVTTDTLGYITSWNRGAEEIYGYSKKEIIGQDISILYKEDESILDELISELMEDKNIPGIEITCLTKQQEEVEILTSLTTIKDENGNVKGLVGITKDITEQKAAATELQEHRDHLARLVEERTFELQESEKRYRGIVEDQTEFIVRYIPDTTRTFVNQSYCRHMEKKYDALVGTRIIDELEDPLLREKYLEKLSRLSPENPMVSEQFEEISSKGITTWIEWIDRAIFDDQGKVIEYQAVGKDITLKKKVELDLLKRTEELEKFNMTMVDRELRIIQIKKEVNQLSEELGREPLYFPFWDIDNQESME
ncbi:MAG: PAS domain S-box protein [Anaerolineaceae bacterium]|nr:PAS domain S-box protein [Anaerolineaceae bacterium]